jgi:hypothetical protein
MFVVDLFVVDLDRYHVLTSANGVGKTTLLDTPVPTGDMLRKRVTVGTFLERQETGRPGPASTLTDLLHKGDAIAFAFEARLPLWVIEVLGASSRSLLGRQAPTHLRYEPRLEITWRTFHRGRVPFPIHGKPRQAEIRRLRAGQGRAEAKSETGMILSHEEWQPVLHPEGGPITQLIEPELEAPKGAAKEPRPKEALGYLRRHHRVKAFNAEFGKLSEAMSVRKCQDPAFVQLRDKLRAWFPEHL